MSDWRNSKEYRYWRAAVISRDKRCVVCNSLKGRQAHHLNHSTYFKELRFDINNGVTLCGGCHSIFHNGFMNNTRQKCTEKEFKQFLEITNYCKTVFTN